MENKQGSEGFHYTYSAGEQAELKRIREKYAPAKQMEEDKMARLRRLDRRVTQKAEIFSLIFGILGSLILGLGMSLIMSELGLALGVLALPVGILTGLVGGVLICLAYPIYECILKKEQERVAPEILRLTEELMQ
ncbi:MAG: hypothetical protein IJ009_03145 [Clostridia bacterium]|nr:hypothetical protein [Clostridia bacterium]